ncbi:hypothetical protein NDU88_005103 [Pleurodeles waltl]|uniref:Uncharacterized protein n=1 Tax=Pleurodeles waltl TaxID=8319 RepID=A0AAV7RN59_PLEWA|nr:hypothetical protein NDU88_005103 [Pleurodeles waltl]
MRGQAVEDGGRELEKLCTPPGLSGHYQGLEGRQRAAGEGVKLPRHPGMLHSRALTFGGSRRQKGAKCAQASGQPRAGSRGLVEAHARSAHRA